MNNKSNSEPAVIRHVGQLRAHIAQFRQQGHTVALVPTMGALHDGHLSLVNLAKNSCDRAVVSIFVNPKQFGPNEDFHRYPRTVEDDLARLAACNVDIVFLPDTDEMYGADFSTTVSVSDIGEGLCAASRPGHFDGVATVVTKLLLQTQPDVAIFGEKDYQQLLLIRRLVRDLNIPVEILGAPIVREQTGLARSSRNKYLSPAERDVAPLLYHTLTSLKDELKNSAGNPSAMEKALEEARTGLLAAGFDRIDYLEIRDAESLKSWSGKKPGRLLAAVYLGSTRLIDNIPL